MRKLKLFITNTLKNKRLLKKVIFYFVDFYSKTTAFVENKALRKNSPSNKFKQNGFFKIKSNKDLVDKLKFFEKTFNTTNSNSKFLSKDEIEELLHRIFSRNNRQKITDLTGFEYSIDHFRIIYDKKSDFSDFKVGIPIPHFDKSFSRNMLKLYISLKKANLSPPLKFFNKKDSKLIKKGIFSKNYNIFSVTGDSQFIYGINANECFHEVIIPEENEPSLSMILQLNPSIKWSFRENLSDLQIYTEPKFTAFTFLTGDNKFFDN